ncbi:MAG: hypothetical protein KGD58_03935 [Candidatus Lokiarchaeota archaeon]|nr:hypothetical protein [Candidatus Lokiarchaeota archaeon]
MSYHIAFDVAHKPRGRIDENLTELRDHVNSNDFVCYNFLEIPITEESLIPYDILVFVCPDFSRINANEVTQIVKWVKNSGGGLLLLSHAGGDRGRGSNLSEISEQFGIIFENDQVLDERVNLGMENIPLINVFNIPHPITSEIDTLCYRSGCSLSIVGSGAFAIADSNETSEPFSCPLICVSELGKGRVCCIGSYEMFRDKIGGGFQCYDHPNLALNIFKWLVSDHRIELRSTLDIPTPLSQSSAPISSAETQSIYSNDTSPSTGRAINIDFSMKISKKSELIELLKIFQNQINTIKTTIDKLIDTATDADTDIVESDQLLISNIEDQYQDNKPITQETPSLEDITSEINSISNLEKDEEGLTSLPPKPESLVQEEVEETGLKPVPKLKTKDKTNKELKDEKKDLESQLSSVEILKESIDKKHSSGKIDDDEYSKRSKKLESDTKKTKKKMGVIDKLLEK